MKKVTQTKVSKTVTHDRMSIAAKYPTGGAVRFSISRNGETLSVAGSNDPQVSREQVKCVNAFCLYQGNETNQNRIDRIAAFLRGVNSVGELCTAIKALPSIAASIK